MNTIVHQRVQQNCAWMHANQLSLAAKQTSATFAENISGRTRMLYMRCSKQTLHILEYQHASKRRFYGVLIVFHCHFVSTARRRVFPRSGIPPPNVPTIIISTRPMFSFWLAKVVVQRLDTWWEDRESYRSARRGKKMRYMWLSDIVKRRCPEPRASSRHKISPFYWFSSKIIPC